MKKSVFITFYILFVQLTLLCQNICTLDFSGKYGINRTEKNKEINVEVFNKTHKLKSYIFNKNKFNISIQIDTNTIYKIRFHKKKFKTIEYTIYTNDVDLSRNYDVKTFVLMTKNLYGMDYREDDTLFSYTLNYIKKYDKFIIDSISLISKQKNISVIRKEMKLLNSQDSLKDLAIQNAIYREKIDKLNIENLKAIQLNKENEILKKEKDLVESNFQIQKREMELLSLNDLNKEKELKLLKQQKQINESKLVRLNEQQQIIGLLLLKKKKEIELEKEQNKLFKKDIELSQTIIETNKRKSQIKNLSRVNEIKEIEIQNQRRNKFIFISVSLLFFFMFMLILKKFKEANKQKAIIQSQKHLVEEKNREILDSITYAKRIQSAILPQPKLVKQFLEDSFILYKPKDIVAGDFYWLEAISRLGGGKGEDNVVLFAAADCTGHGVPGAMVSVVCNNGLNRSVREFGLTNPNEILDKTRELVIQEFEKSDEDVKDGMDISLCALNTKTNILKWSGANNPLWILRSKEIIEHKGDKQPIGKHFDSKPFSLTEIQLEKHDLIYIFTDGFQDQFGGEKQKKYRVSQMKELFLSIANKKMEEQRQLIDESFESWKGDLEQIDDVCLIGVRI